MSTNLLEHRFIEGVVGNLNLFHEAEPAQVAMVARQSWVLPARRGDTLVRRGERMPGVFVVVYGLAKLVLRGGGGERVLRLVGDGQTFGEPCSLLGRPSLYEALALADAKLVVIPSTPLLDLMGREPRFGRAVARVLAERAFELLGEVEAATMQRSAQRLAAYLATLAARAGDGPPAVHLPVSKTLVAARLGVKKATLSRLLRRFARDGLIEVSGRDVRILDGAGLDRVASSA